MLLDEEKPTWAFFSDLHHTYFHASVVDHKVGFKASGSIQQHLSFDTLVTKLCNLYLHLWENMIPFCSSKPVCGLLEVDTLLLGLLWDIVSLCDAVLKGEVLAIMENLNLEHSQGNDSAVRLLSTLWGDIINRCWIQVWLQQLHFHLATVQGVDGAMISWAPGSLTLFWETSVSSLRGWALAEENTGLDHTNTLLPWQKGSNINVGVRFLHRTAEEKFTHCWPFGAQFFRHCWLKCWSSTNTWRNPSVWIHYWKQCVDG